MSVKAQTENYNPRRWRIVKVIVAVAFVLYVLAFAGGLTPVPIRRLHTNFDRWGTDIWLIGTSGFLYHWTGHLAVFSIQRVGPLKDLNDLRGSVHLSNAGDALRFVRLRTSPDTYRFWDGNLEAEVTTSDEAPKLPGFGLDIAPGPPYNAGFLGVLPRESFHRGGFTPARIETMPKGFRVTQWIYSEQYEPSYTASVQKIQEYIGQDGSYRRIILIKKEPPKLPDVLWEFETFE